MKSATVKRAVKSSLRSVKKSVVCTAGEATRVVLSDRNPKGNAKLNLSRAKAGIEKALTGALMPGRPTEAKRATKKPARLVHTLGTAPVGKGKKGKKKKTVHSPMPLV